jgi:RNA polymerase sigma-70 factor (ECF subfamily)
MFKQCFIELLFFSLLPELSCNISSFFHKKPTFKKRVFVEVSHSHIDILTVIDGCKKNERSRQSALYNWLYGFALKICYRYVSNLPESEELANESFLKLFKNIPQFDVSRQLDTEALLKAWFKRIIINTCIDHLRKQHISFSQLTVAEENDIFVHAEETGLSKLSYKEIIQAIRQLTPGYRTVFNLFVIEGLSHDEIANLLNISVGASKSNLSKARNNLRKLLTYLQEYQKTYAAS